MKRLTRPKPKAAAKPTPMTHDDVRTILRGAAADLRAIIGKLEPITSGGLPPVPTSAWDGDGSDECLMVEGDIPESLDFHFRTAIIPGDLRNPEGYSYPVGDFCLEEIAWHLEQIAAATTEKLEDKWRERVRSLRGAAAAPDRETSSEITKMLAAVEGGLKQITADLRAANERLPELEARLAERQSPAGSAGEPAS